MIFQYMMRNLLHKMTVQMNDSAALYAFQMKMFLTRLGFGSKIVITGDVTQIDLPQDKTSGLKEAMRVLNGVEDVAICQLTGSDVVRHVLVQRIIEAYEKYEGKKPAEADKPRSAHDKRKVPPMHRR